MLVKIKEKGMISLPSEIINAWNLEEGCYVDISVQRVLTSDKSFR